MTWRTGDDRKYLSDWSSRAGPAGAAGHPASLTGGGAHGEGHSGYSQQQINVCMWALYSVALRATMQQITQGWAAVNCNAVRWTVDSGRITPRMISRRAAAARCGQGAARLTTACPRAARPPPRLKRRVTRSLPPRCSTHHKGLATVKYRVPFLFCPTHLCLVILKRPRRRNALVSVHV